MGRKKKSIKALAEGMKAYEDKKKDMQDADFDYAIHCKDRENDPHYYCFHEEGCHIIYHRFTPEDYADLIS